MTHKNMLGLFVHFGPYAMLGIHEQALARCRIDREEYEAMAMQFNPTAYDPDEWVRMAKAAGMKYITFTTKHHDGFCMWDTKTTDYGIMHTPYGRDVLAMLADACKKEGIKLPFSLKMIMAARITKGPRNRTAMQTTTVTSKSLSAKGSRSLPISVIH